MDQETYDYLIPIGIVVIILVVYYSQIYMSDNIEDMVTICVKTIYRKNALKEFIKKTRTILPTITIIIADDSSDYYKNINSIAINEISPNDNNILHLKLPYNVGAAEGRNLAVEKVNTPYTLITDDTRYLSDINSLYKLIDYLKYNNDISLITGSIIGRKDANDYTNLFKYVKINNIIEKSKQKILNSLNNIENIDVYCENINRKLGNFHKTDIGYNCFIARTSMLKENKWYNKLKHSDGYVEHEDFFIRLWLNNIHCLYSPEFKFIQMDDKLREYDNDGQRLRDAYKYKDRYMHIKLITT